MDFWRFDFWRGRCKQGLEQGAEHVERQNLGSPGLASPDASVGPVQRTHRQPPRLMDQVRDVMKAEHYSPKTAEAYLRWIRAFIIYHGRRHPRDMGVAEVNDYLVHLSKESNLSASSQTQALSSMIHTHVLNRGGRGVRSPLDED